MRYPEQINLPFNASCLKNKFTFRGTITEEPTGPGVWAIIQGNSTILVQEGEVLTLPEGALPDWLVPREEPLFIGMWQGRPLRAISLGPDHALEPPFVAEPFNAVVERIDIATLTLAGMAKQILHWERMSRYCSRCGGKTGHLSGGWGKQCSACNSEHFPHIHPCAIVLVTRGDELLLTRKPEWAPGRYSLVAGFLDFGESLEECAVREVMEETGITIRNVRYAGSQNWPFPAQLMAGFVADYAGGEIVVDPNELEDARWFNVDALPVLPPKRSIARWIIDGCVR